MLRRKRCSRCREPGCNAAAAIIGTGCRNKGTSAQKGFGGSRPRITSKYSQAAKFVATSAAPKAMSSQNQRVRPVLLNAAHSITATVISQRPVPLRSEKAVSAPPGVANRETTVYTSRKPATVPISHRVRFLMRF